MSTLSNRYISKGGNQTCIRQGQAQELGTWMGYINVKCAHMTIHAPQLAIWWWPIRF